MNEKIEWTLLDTEVEPQTFCAVGHRGQWKSFLSQYALELLWYPEKPTPELLEQADRVWDHISESGAQGTVRVSRKQGEILKPESGSVTCSA